MLYFATYPKTQFFQFHLSETHRRRYTNPKSTGTSIRGPTVAASAWSLLGPNVVIATAMASSKLLLAAVKLCVVERGYPKPACRDTRSVAKKIMTK